MRAVSEALRGGEGRIGFVQLREESSPIYPPADKRELGELLGQLSDLCQRHEVKLIVNRRTELVGSGLADGVHIGAESPSVEEIRSQIGSDALIGYSAHSVREALSALERQVSYVFLSPIFKPISKTVPDSAGLLGVSSLRELTKQTSGRVYALGGVTAANCQLCRQAGAYGVAMLSSVLMDEDPRRAVEEVIRAWYA